MKQIDILKSWLDNAYAMESAIADTLKQHRQEAEGHPDVQHQLEQHRFETEGHAEKVRQRLASYGVDVSDFKATVASMMGKAQNAMMGMPKYELVQNAITDFATEHYEIALYKAIMNLARQLEDMDTVIVCREIIAEEERMADWLETHLGQVVQEEVREKARAR